MKRHIILITIFGILVFPECLWAGEYYGSLQYSDATSGVTHIVFQYSDSKKFCEALNENFRRGHRTSCPQCKLELSGCDTSLPSAYRGIFNDKPIIFPYVSAPYTRIVIFGPPLQQSKEICREMARRWQESMNQKAKCISN